jgi:hypothetical protein
VGNTNDTKTAESILEARRKSVRKILGAGGLLAGGHAVSGKWVRPVVDAVVLPAHAATSPGGSPDSLEDPCMVSVTCTEDGFGDVTVSGSVEPPTDNVDVDIVITALQNLSGDDFELASPSTTTNSSGEYEVTLNNVDLSATNNVTGISVLVTLPDFPEAGTAECGVDVTDDGPHDYLGDSNIYFCDGARR